jgi:hypothetical protein
MPNLEDQAKPAIEKLMQSDADQLYAELGLRQNAIKDNAQVAGQFDAAVSYDAPFAGPLDILKEFGQDLFDRLSKSIYDLVCSTNSENEEDRKKLEAAVHLGTTALATSLASLLVSSFFLAPAIAAVVATIAVKLFFKDTYGAFCDTWKKHLPA